MVKTTIEKQWKGKEVKIQGQKVISDSIFEIGLVVEGEAKLLAAKDTGYLAASINTQASDGRGTEPDNPNKYRATKLNKKSAEYAAGAFSALVLDKIKAPDSWENECYVGTNIDYAPHVEFGTVRSDAQPFLRPALALAKGEALTIVQVNGKMQFKEYLQ